MGLFKHRKLFDLRDSAGLPNDILAELVDALYQPLPSLIVGAASVTFVGAIPAELQPRFAYSGALTTTSKEPDAARALIRFLASPEAAATITRAGLAPTGTR